VGEVRGQVEVEDGVLVVRRVHVEYTLRVDAGADRDKIQRAFETHPPKCPMYRTISGSVEITTSLSIEEP
jgi:uncharacterized OsmC-like protein